MRKLLVTGTDFKWVGPKSYYFDSEEAWKSLGLFIALIGVYFIPVLINSVVRYLHENNAIRKRHYAIYCKIVQVFDTRIPQTSLSILDAAISFSWMLINICFVQPKDYPGQIGYLVVANSGLVLIPAYRNSLFVTFLQVPFERTVKYHRWLGRGIMVLMTIHMVGYWDKWIRAGTFETQILVLPNLFAHLAWLSGLILSITSLGYIRRNWFEFFFFSHFAYIFFFIFGILHFPPMLPIVLPGLIMFFFDRVVRRLRANPKNDYVDVQSQGGITRIRGRRLGILNYECGQYAFLNIPEVSKLQWHPISFTSCPSDAQFQFNIKTLGKWSQALTKLNGRKNVEVKIDGPYGILTHDVTKYDVVVICAGGIGITPMISIIRDLHYKITTGMIQPMKVYVFWTMRDPSMYYSFGDCFDDILNGPVSTCFNISVWITQPGAASPMFIRGRPDWSAIFRTIRELHSDVDRIGVLSCGPSMLVDAAWDSCNRYSTKATTFDFHQETFEF